MYPYLGKKIFRPAARNCLVCTICINYKLHAGDISMQRYIYKKEL